MKNLVGLMVVFAGLLPVSYTNAKVVTAIKCHDVDGDRYGQLLISVEAEQIVGNQNMLVYDIKSNLKLQVPYSTLLEIPKEYVSASLVFQGGGWQLMIDARNLKTDESLSFMGNSGSRERKSVNGWSTYSYLDRESISHTNRKIFECNYGSYSEP